MLLVTMYWLALVVVIVTAIVLALHPDIPGGFVGTFWLGGISMFALAGFGHTPPTWLGYPSASGKSFFLVIGASATRTGGFLFSDSSNYAFHRYSGGLPSDAMLSGSYASASLRTGTATTRKNGTLVDPTSTGLDTGWQMVGFRSDGTAIAVDQLFRDRWSGTSIGGRWWATSSSSTPCSRTATPRKSRATLRTSGASQEACLVGTPTSPARRNHRATKTARLFNSGGAMQDRRHSHLIRSMKEAVVRALIDWWHRNTCEHWKANVAMSFVAAIIPSSAIRWSVGFWAMFLPHDS